MLYHFTYYTVFSYTIKQAFKCLHSSCHRPLQLPLARFTPVLLHVSTCLSSDSPSFSSQQQGLWLDTPPCQGGHRNLYRSPQRALKMDRHIHSCVHTQTHTLTHSVYISLWQPFLSEKAGSGPVNLGTTRFTPVLAANDFTVHSKGQHSSGKEDLQATLKPDCQISHLPRGTGQILSLPAIKWANDIYSIQATVRAQWEPRAVPGTPEGSTAVLGPGLGREGPSKLAMGRPTPQDPWVVVTPP